MSEKKGEKEEKDASKPEDISPKIISSQDREVISRAPPNKEILSYFLHFHCMNCQSPIALKSDSASLKIKCPNCKKINVFY